jgi:hypothetical protein
MMRSCRWAIFLSLQTLLLCSTAFTQQSVIQPEPPNGYRRLFRALPMKAADTRSNARFRYSPSALTIPLWSYSVNSLGNLYSGAVVGRAPYFHGHRSTTTPTLMIPVVLAFQYSGIVFNPATVDPCLGDSVEHVVASSPIFQPIDWILNGTDMGTTQYVDAFQRAEFWSYVGGTPHHTMMGLTVLNPIQVTVPAQFGLTEFGSCGPIGLMDINWWDSLVQSEIIPQLASQGVNTTDLPLFLFDSVVEYENDNPNDCCVLGYHSAYMPNGLLQTYSIASFDTSGAFGGDVSILSHELAEWMNDPAVNNPTPSWGHVGQVQGCQANLEVGDPLSGTLLPSVNLNGFEYHMQELAFFSWFYREEPSLGAGGLYSDNGTFRTDAGQVCQ